MRHQVDWKDPDYAPTWRQRAERLRRLRALDEDQLALVLAHYANSPVDFIEDWCVTYDPRPSDGVSFLPFLLFPRQRELVGWLHGKLGKRKAGVLEKSRDTGISWVAAAFGAWAWLFHDAKIGYGSYDADHVDVLGNMDSIMEKVRTTLRYLPEEFLPAGFDKDRHMMHKRIVRPDSVATITGEVGKNIGRGGRSTMYFVDEAAHLVNPELADASLSATTECVIWASTPFGLGNFHQKCTGGAFDLFRFHWTGDPRKDDAWAAEKKRLVGPVIWAQEYDLDHGASVERVTIEPKWVHAARRIRRMLGDKGHAVPPRHHYEPGIAGLDVGGGSSKSVFIARNGPHVRPPKDWGEGDTTLTAKRAVRYAKSHHTPVLNFDAIGVGAGVASTLRHSNDLFLPPPETPAGEQKPDQGIEDLVNQAAAASNPVLDEAAILVGDKIRARAINVGQPASNWVKWEDGKISNEKFANLRAEVWWTMRDRFQKTHEHWLWLQGEEGGYQHPIDELVFLPDHDTLATQLSVLTWYELPSGKIAMESKKDLASRGVASPDFADALSLTFVPRKAGFSTSKIENWT